MNSWVHQLQPSHTILACAALICPIFILNMSILNPGIPHISHITHTHTVTAKVMIAKPVGEKACLPMFCYGQIGMLLLFAKGEAQTLRGFWHLSFSVSFSASQAMLLFRNVILLHKNEFAKDPRWFGAPCCE